MKGVDYLLRRGSNTRDRVEKFLASMSRYLARTLSRYWIEKAEGMIFK